MTDILSLQPDVKTLIPKHPLTGEPIELEIDLRSMDSPEVLAVERQLKTKALRAGRNNVTVEKLEDGEYAILHACIVAWRWTGSLDLAGVKNPPLTRENSERLFRSAPWLKKQVNTELSDEAGFFDTAKKPSLNT